MTYYVHIFQASDGVLVERRGPYKTQSEAMDEELVINLNPNFDECVTTIEVE